MGNSPVTVVHLNHPMMKSSSSSSTSPCLSSSATQPEGVNTQAPSCWYPLGFTSKFHRGDASVSAAPALLRCCFHPIMSSQSWAECTKWKEGATCTDTAHTRGVDPGPTPNSPLTSVLFSTRSSQGVNSHTGNLWERKDPHVSAGEP